MPARRALLLAAMVAATPARAQPPVEAFIRQAEQAFRDARVLPDRAAQEARCVVLMAEMFDGVAIAESVAEARWAALPPGLRSALARAVEARLGHECRAVMARPDPGPASIARVRDAAGGALRVTTQLPATDGSGSVLVWTLAPGGAWGMQARDLVSDGRGVAATLRAEFGSALAARGGDMAAAIADFGRGR